MGVLRKVFRISRYNIAFRLFVMTAVTGSLFAATILYSLAEMKHTRASLEHVTNTIGKLVSNAHAIRNGVHLDETPCEPIEPEKAPARSGKGETILVVEDDGEVRGVVKSLLSGLGYRLIVSGHPQDAISKMTSSHPAVDLLITDVVMPGMSGYALAELFLRHYPGSPVLYMSGYANSNLNSGGEMAAGFDYIQKPFTSEPC